MGKWVAVDDVGRSAAEVAAKILEMRVGIVQQMLPLAANDYRDDIEHVHQLRVGCRRASAAFESFRPLLKRKSKRLRKWLQKIRRAAGPARDADVLLTRLLAESDTQPGHDYLVARLKRRRKTVQRDLVAVAKKTEQGGLAKSLRQSVKSLRKRASAPQSIGFALFARDALKSASQDMFHLAGLQHPTVDQLHQLRISGKRLRYSIELFHSAFPEMLCEEIYPLVENIQSHLGTLNDHASAQALFQHWLTDLPPDERAAQLARRLIEEHESAVVVRREFLAWWTPKRVAKFQAQLSELLSG